MEHHVSNHVITYIHRSRGILTDSVHTCTCGKLTMEFGFTFVSFQHMRNN